MIHVRRKLDSIRGEHHAYRYFHNITGLFHGILFFLVFLLYLFWDSGQYQGNTIDMDVNKTRRGGFDYDLPGTFSMVLLSNRTWTENISFIEVAVFFHVWFKTQK